MTELAIMQLAEAIRWVGWAIIWAGAIRVVFNK